ncbi:MAG: glycosyltransferase family 2 protein [Fibrobacter sp.]|nr:glycosyltransferase family 2 protein [Fibrobacter sp.]
MQNQRLAVNCLVQVKTDNRLDFEEWVNYHIALGFDTIFVCDTGNRAWLDEVCNRRKEHVVLAPRDERWQYKSEIIKDYVSRREFEEWCICLDDHDFLWISPARARSIIEYVDLIPRSVAAVTFYVKHMSSKEPTRYRVGTQIDCFCHTRREPEGFFPAYNAFPNDGVTLFHVNDTNMPLRDPVTPVYANKWVDSEFRQMTPNRFKEETASKRFYPTAYSVRCYRYAIRSGVEMNFNDKLVPVGFDVQDLSMQKAREMYLHIPVNPETEKLFAKKEAPEPAPAVPTPVAESAEDKALPITKARIDKLIFKGMFLEDIVQYVEAKTPNFDHALLEEMFETERRNIIASSSLYTSLQELIDQEKTDDEIRRALCLTETTLARMKVALPVLDIRTEFAKSELAIPAAESKIQVKVGAEAAPVTEEDADDEALVEAFEQEQSDSLPTEEELAARTEAIAIMDEKAKPKSRKKATAAKKAKTGAKKKKAAVVAGTAKEIAPEAPAAAPAAPAPEVKEDTTVEDALEGIEDSELGDINFDAIVSNVQTALQDLPNG